jgi:hypothetical protein
VRNALRSSKSCATETSRRGSGSTTKSGSSFTPFVAAARVMIARASSCRPRAASHEGLSSTNGMPSSATRGGTAARKVSHRQPSGSRPPGPSSSRRQCAAMRLSATLP